MATLSHIAVYPVSSLDPVSVDRVSFTDSGGLVTDRTYVIVDADGNRVDGTESAALHGIRSTVDLESEHVVLRADGRAARDPPGESPKPAQFPLGGDHEGVENWLSTYLGTSVQFRETDGTDGPRLIARATLREVASWYDVTTAEMRMRVRPNLVVAGVPAFWEEKLLGDGQRVRIGDTVLDGERLVEQSAVLSRDPYTGAALSGFRERFERRRRETLPDWTDPATFDDEYDKLSVELHVPADERDGRLAAGDEVTLLDADWV